MNEMKRGQAGDRLIRQLETCELTQEAILDLRSVFEEVPNLEAFEVILKSILALDTKLRLVLLSLRLEKRSSIENQKPLCMLCHAQIIFQARQGFSPPSALSCIIGNTTKKTAQRDCTACSKTTLHHSARESAKQPCLPLFLGEQGLSAALVQRMPKQAKLMPLQIQHHSVV